MHTSCDPCGHSTGYCNSDGYAQRRGGLQPAGRDGSIAPGKVADIVFVNDLAKFDIARVMADGEMIVENGVYLPRIAKTEYPSFMYNTVVLEGAGYTEALQYLHRCREGKPSSSAPWTSAYTLRRSLQSCRSQVKSFSRIPGRISCASRWWTRAVNGNVGNGFIKGFQLQKGAVASSVNAVCENIVVVGTNNEDMALAVNTLANMGEASRGGRRQNCCPD